MTENRIEIKQADRNIFRETSMDAFDRFQQVQNVWRMENGRLVLKFRPFTETWTPERRREKAGEILSGRYITFCAFAGDTVVGEIMLIPELNENRLIIDSFHVSRAFRRRGIGRRLIETAADYARGRGASALYASCCSAEETIAFYKAMGFRLSEHPIPSRVEEERFDLQMERRLFTTKGPMPESLQTLNAWVWQEWFPKEGKQRKANDMATLEVYSAGNPRSPDYESGIWVPLKEV